jgi:hypothetical protein
MLVAKDNVCWWSLVQRIKFGTWWSLWNLYQWKPNLKFLQATLCQLHKCSACLEINKKVKENVKSHYKTKLCFIRQKLAPVIKGMCFWKDIWTRKWIDTKKTLTNWWQQDIKRKGLSYWN